MNDVTIPDDGEDDEVDEREESIKQPISIHKKQKNMDDWLKNRDNSERLDIRLELIQDSVGTYIKDLTSYDRNTSVIVGNVNNLISQLEEEVNKNSKAGQRFESINVEIGAIKQQLIELEEQKKLQRESIKTFENFVDQNLQFMVIATQADGRMKNIEKRLDQIEDKSNKSKDRSIAIWAIAFSFIASVITCIVSVLIAVFAGN